MPLVALAPPGGSNDLDRYELLFRFAAGGMAEVFVARQRGEGGFLRPVAIKRMLPALAEEPKFVEMFLDEARLAAHVTSPYVVSTLDCGKDEEGSPYIVMELVVGVSLSQALRAAAEKRRHAPPAILAEIIAQTALGLYDAHEARTPTGQALRIVHRDVSPQNVLLGVDGRARLTDFGVARALERVTRTATGEVKGKLSYFSPEQARMEPLDHRSDIFALGIVAWEALALERLFSRDNPMQALTAILHERIPDPREHNPELPEKLVHVVMRALERDVSKRPATARIFAEELRAAVGTPATATTIGKWVEESGGPRLDTFRKRIETSFRARAQAVGEAVAAEAERSSPSAASNAASFSSSPESRVVGSLGTLPDRPPEESSQIEPRTQASGVSLVSSTRVASNPGYDVPVITVAPPEAPSRSRAPLYIGGALVALAAIGVGTAALVIGSAPPTTPTPPAALAPAAPALAAPALAAPALAAPALAAPALAAPEPTAVTATTPPITAPVPPQGSDPPAPPSTGVASVASTSDETPARRTPSTTAARTPPTTTRVAREETRTEETAPQPTRETTPPATTTRTETPPERTATTTTSASDERGSTGSVGDPQPGPTTTPGGRLTAGTGAGRLRGSQ